MTFYCLDNCCKGIITVDGNLFDFLDEEFKCPICNKIYLLNYDSCWSDEGESSGFFSLAYKD